MRGFARLVRARAFSHVGTCRFRDESLMRLMPKSLYNNMLLGSTWSSRVSSTKVANDLRANFGPFNIPNSVRKVEMGRHGRLRLSSPAFLDLTLVVAVARSTGA